MNPKLVRKSLSNKVQFSTSEIMTQRVSVAHVPSQFYGGVPVICHRRPNVSRPYLQFQAVPNVVSGGITRSTDRVLVRQVFKNNMKEEVALIKGFIQRGYTFASMDTEFPGIVVPPKIDRHLMSQAAPADMYEMMRDNVDKTHIIQLGLTVSDHGGNLPVIGHSYCCWEFNFSDFDVDCGDHLRNNDSIELLKRQGIDFANIKKTGIASAEFAREIQSSDLANILPQLTWATFQSAYDFGFLIKIFTGKKLPEDVKEFMGQVKSLFGNKLFDVKCMMKLCDGLFGGLEGVATKLGVGRIVGNSHQAGSDSLLILQTYLQLLKSEETKGRANNNYKNYLKLSEESRGVIYGLGSVDC